MPRAWIKILPYIAYLVALALGIVAWKWPQANVTLALLLSLVTGLVGQLFDIRIVIHGLETRVEKLGPQWDLEREIWEKCTDDNFLQRRYDQLNSEFRNLAEGGYSVHSIEEVYLDDVRQIKRMKRGETLRSSCPISTKTVDAIKQIKDRYYLDSMKAHFDASKRGVNIKRLYIFSSAEMLETELFQHLRKIPKFREGVKVIFRDTVEDADIDFLVFGNRTVSMGVVSTNTGLCIGTIVTQRRDKVRDAIHRFDGIWDMAYTVDQLAEDPTYQRLLPSNGTDPT